MRAQSNKVYSTASGGLITEASPLTYPENSSLDEDNCLIFPKGNRSRRLGFKEEADYTKDINITKTDLEAGLEVNEFSWQAVNENGDDDILVVQVGSFLHFYDLQTENQSNNKLGFVLDLNNYLSDATKDMKDYRVAMANGKGYLFVVGKYLEPISIEYKPDTASITTRQIYIKMRDFVGLDDGLSVDDEPTTLGTEHLYNLKNQGWVAPNKDGAVTIPTTAWSSVNIVFQSFNQASTPITDYFNIVGRYPGNNKQWWVGRIVADDTAKGLTAGDLDPDLLNKAYYGNTRAPRGHYVLDAFNKDRSAVSGVSGIAVEDSAYRPVGVSFYAGRTWFSLNSTLYYSQVLNTYKQAGNCYQEADPTAEGINDLIASDGGVIPIPEADNIVRLYPAGGGLIVLADNGIWFVSGGGEGFTATAISVTKISDNGIVGRDTLVEADGALYWWSKVGIMSLKQKSGLFGAQDGAFDRVNITEATIQSFYNNSIPPSKKQYAKGIHDPANNTIQWLFSDETDVQAKNFYNRILNLNVVTGAFYPWTISNSGSGPYISGAYRRTEVKQIAGKGYTTTKGPDTFNTLVKYTFLAPTTVTTCQLSFGEFSNTDFSDWPGEEPEGTGYAYLSFMETGYELLQDLMRDKQQNYVVTYFRRTEQNIDTDGTPDAPSSCFFRTKWDWSNSEISNQWSRKVQIYRRGQGRKTPSTTAGDSFDDGYAVVVSKNKVRGRGKSIQLRFENGDIGSNFDLLGWATNYTGNTVV